MDNASIADMLQHYGKLLELHGENSFKSGAYIQAPFAFKKFDTQLSGLSPDELLHFPFLGKSLLTKVIEILQKGSFDAYDSLLRATPHGLLELLQIRGLGPKKLRVLWQELQIQSPGELMYACLENRLLDLKGFGEKSQQSLLDELQFRELNKSSVLYARIEATATELLQLFRKTSVIEKVEITGEYRRQCEIVNALEFVVVCSHLDGLISILSGMGLHIHTLDATVLKTEIRPGFPLVLHLATHENFQAVWLTTSSSLAHLAMLRELPESAVSEEEIYHKNGYYFIPPYLREGRDEFEKAAKGNFLPPIQTHELRGAIHNHSLWSDGQHSIRDMALFCIEQGWEYLAICDHSKTATYAGGLSVERVLKQKAEIDLLNIELAPFKIFHGIESDILADGSLDYEPDILAQFDLVVASVHSQLKMNQEKAMDRLRKAIENPYTTILGHPTGRLLLSREGYPIDTKEIIDACAENHVVIELNANPNRLDLDWRFLEYAQNKGVLISINPDAHRKESLLEMKYGVAVAQKASILKESVLNTKNVKELTLFLDNRRKLKGI